MRTWFLFLFGLNLGSAVINLSAGNRYTAAVLGLVIAPAALWMAHLRAPKKVGPETATASGPRERSRPSKGGPLR